MDGASKLNLQELRGVAKFILDTEHLGLYIVPTMNLGLVVRHKSRQPCVSSCREEDPTLKG